MRVLVTEAGRRLLEARAARLDADLDIVWVGDDHIARDRDGREVREPRPDVAWVTADTFARPGAADTWIRLLADGDTLRWLQSPAAGYLAFYDGLLERGVRVTGAHVNAIPIAEYVLQAVLGHFQRANDWDDARAEHEWRPHQFREVYGTTWIVVGVGAIGSEVARRATAFGAEVVGVRRNPTSDEPVDRMLTPAELLGALPGADVVVLATPSTTETVGLVDARFLEAMARDSVLVNIARGALVDEHALLAALDRGRPEAAILDAFVTEPLPPDHPFWDHPRILLTPHTSAGGLARHDRGADLFLENLRRYRHGEPLLHEVLPAHADPTRSTVDLVPRAATGAVLAPSTPVATPTATPGEAPPHFATLDEIGAAAERNLPADVWAYVEGGAEDEVTLGRNRDAFARRLLRPRVLTGVATPDLATTLLGMVLASPLGVAPFAGDTLLHPAGFRSVLRACAALGAPVIVPETSAESLEALRAAEPDAARIFQMSNRHPDDVQEALVRRAFGAGYEALCVTVDVPVVGVRRRELRHRFRGAERIEAANMAHTDRATGSPAWTWDRLAELIGAAGVPVIVKGIMCGADARAAVDAGAAAVYVSNHGGRQLDPCPATLDVLEEVVGAVGADAEIVFDGGVRSGSSALTALALGARVVLVGRPVAAGLAAAGVDGVTRVLDILTHELATAMTLVGRPTVESLDRSIVVDAGI